MATSSDGSQSRAADDEDAELERLAAEEIVREAKRGKDRAERMGVIGWKKLPSANKVYLHNMMTNAIRANKRKELPKCTYSKDQGKKSRYNEEAISHKCSDNNSMAKHRHQSKKYKQYNSSRSDKVSIERNALHKTDNKH